MFKLRNVSASGRRSDRFFSSATATDVPDRRSRLHCTPPGAFFATGRLMRETHRGNDADLGNIYSYGLGEGGIIIMPLAMARAVALETAMALRRRVGNFGKC